MGKKIDVSLHNEFEIVCRDASSGEIKQVGKAYNIILNGFWNKFLSSSTTSCLSYIAYGSGTAEPVATDTALTTFVGYKSAAKTYDYSTVNTDGVVKIRGTCRLETTDNVGATISEVGFSSSTSSSSGLMTKALIEDANGNPLTIVKGASDVIDIFATFFVKFPAGSNDFEVDTFGISTNTYTIAGAMCFASAMNYEHSVFLCNHRAVRTQAISGAPHDSVSNGSVGVSFNVAERKMTHTIGNLTAGSANGLLGIESICVGGIVVRVPSANFVQPTIIKEVIATGDGTTKDFKCKFGRIKNDGNAKLYVNDVEVPATFDYDMPASHGNLNGYLPYNRVSDTEIHYENIYRASIPITGVRGGRFTAYASDDNATWVQVASRNGADAIVGVASEHQGKRYWKITGDWFRSLYSSVQAANLFVHATTAPAAGSTVSLSYTPDCIAKDEQKTVTGMSIVYTFNEYTP